MALLTGPEGDEDEEGETTASPRNAADDEEALMAGLYVSTDVKLHVMSGLRINASALLCSVFFPSNYQISESRAGCHFLSSAMSRVFSLAGCRIVGVHRYCILYSNK